MPPSLPPPTATASVSASRYITLPNSNLIYYMCNKVNFYKFWVLTGRLQACDHSQHWIDSAQSERLPWIQTKSLSLILKSFIKVCLLPPPEVIAIHHVCWLAGLLTSGPGCNGTQPATGRRAVGRWHCARLAEVCALRALFPVYWCDNHFRYVSYQTRQQN